LEHWTEAAEQSFQIAFQHAQSAGVMSTQHNLSAEDQTGAAADVARAMFFLTVGIEELSAGLREGSELLEQIYAGKRFSKFKEVRMPARADHRVRAYMSELDAGREFRLESVLHKVESLEAAYRAAAKIMNLDLVEPDLADLARKFFSKTYSLTRKMHQCECEDGEPHDTIVFGENAIGLNLGEIHVADRPRCSALHRA
jgi:hypothetical protein